MENNKEIKKEILLKTTSTWDGLKYEKLDIQNTEVTVLKITIPPKKELPMHKHTMLNVAYVNKGNLTVTTDDGQEQTFKAGETLAEVVNKFHYGRNDGEEFVELIVFYVGEVGAELSVNKL
ncbi:MAG: cupin domain-containing protein [Candidatus Gastranaerophilaceae bacterium]